VGHQARTPPEAVDAYFAGVNSERFEDVAALFAPDGALIAPGTPPRRGADIAAYFAAALAPYSDHHDEPTRVVVAGQTVTVEIHFTGRTATGAPLEFDAVDVFDFDGEGRIARLSSWYDSHLVRKKLAAIRSSTS
jgi:ketosteroid isomerase-like protein